MNTGWWEIDIHGCYSLVKIAFAQICACKNNRWIWYHNASISPSRDLTDPLWWRHNVKSETTVLGDNCEMSDRWLFLAELMRFANDFHSWRKSLANRLTLEPKIVIHGNSCILYVFYCYSMCYYIQHSDDKVIRYWTHKRHPISCPHWQAVGLLLYLGVNSHCFAKPYYAGSV